MSPTRVNIPFSTRATTLERIATVMEIEPEEFEEYAQKGYRRGRTVTKPPWNKGLTKDDPRVMSYINNRKK